MGPPKLSTNRSRTYKFTKKSVKKRRDRQSNVVKYRNRGEILPEDMTEGHVSAAIDHEQCDMETENEPSFVNTATQCQTDKEDKGVQYEYDYNIDCENIASGVKIEGRRIVEIAVLAAHLEKGCIGCHTALSLSKIDSEYRMGVASILFIYCACGILNKIPTGKQHHDPTKKKTMTVYDVNTKLAGAMINAGMGASHVIAFLSALEVPPPDPKTIQTREREVATHIRAIANESCQEALELEKIKSPREERIEEEITCDEALALLEEDENPDESARPMDTRILKGKYDMGWQKRSSGRRYDSLSGVGVMVGQETGKIIAFGTRQKNCKTCSYAERKGTDPTPHECYKNYEGSSRSMEADVAVELVRELEKDSQVKLGALIMDDDSTTISRIRQELPHEVEKFSDYMHTRKHVTSALYKLQKNHRQLTTDVIKYFTRGFAYALTQNAGDESAVTAALQAIVPHAFGDHQLCDETWCKANCTEKPYVYKSLPNGKPLEGASFKRDLDAVFSKMVDNVARIAPCYSTKENESFNSMVAAKAPKSRHYSSSGSFRTRVESAVAQKNIGNDYLSKVYSSNGLSPGNFYRKHANRVDKNLKRNNIYKNKKENKSRRLLFKMKRRTNQAVAEVREGATYSTEVDLQVEAGVDIESIPPPVNPPVYHPLTSLEGKSIVFFDLETTSFSKDCDIIQIAASFNQDLYNTYIMPDQVIPPKVAELTGLKVFNGKLYHHSKVVQTSTPSVALTDFLNWLSMRRPVVLAAHNCKSFDAPRLYNHVKKHNLLHSFQGTIDGFMDTLPLFKATYKLPNYQQKTVVTFVLKEDYLAHDAKEDSKVLEKTYRASEKIFAEKEIILSEYTCQTEDMENKFQSDKLKAANLPSLNCLIAEKVMGKDMVERAAASGLHFKHLELAFKRSNGDGIQKIFSEINTNGKARVTKSKRIISSVNTYLSTHCK